MDILEKKLTPEVRTMCHRCGGLMVPETFTDLMMDYYLSHGTAWHCVNCGETVDRVILHHRRRPSVRRPIARLSIRPRAVASVGPEFPVHGSDSEKDSAS